MINDESEVQNAGTALARAWRGGEAAPGLAGASAGSPRLSFSRVARPREPRDRWSSWVCFCFSYPFLPFPPKHPACPFKIDVVVSLDMCVPCPGTGHGPRALSVSSNVVAKSDQKSAGREILAIYSKEEDPPDQQRASLQNHSEISFPLHAVYEFIISSRKAIV